MAVAPDKRPDRHYDFRRTNVLFAWSSLLLLVVTVWMIFADYAKPWKRLQSQFRDLERRAARGQLEAERQRLNEQEITAAQQEIAQANERLTQQRGEIGEIEDSIEELGKKVYAADARARGTKSLLDTARYQYDASLQEGEESVITEARDRVDRLRSRWIDERKEVEALTAERDGAQEELDGKRADLTDAERHLQDLDAGLAAQQKRLATLDKKLDYFVLNAPLMDFVLPTLKVDQVMLPGLFQDINFTDVDRVDRCLTCHVAATRAGFDGEEWKQPFRTHPRPEIFLSAASPHPYTKFGCSACHGGLDRSTDFARVGHSPASVEQEVAWKEQWGWKPQKFLEAPIYPAPYSEAGCVTCHASEVWTPGSLVQDAGRELITRMGCYGCHLIDYPAFRDLPRPGPTLARVSSKTTPAWAARWIAAPRDFHPTTWMPHFFYQENTQLPENLAKQQAEIVAAVTYIWEHSETIDYPSPPAGDADHGRELFETVGCQGCHILDADAKRDDFFPDVYRLNGPNLIRTGSKVNPGWLYAWIRNPKQYNPNTRMPNLRLTEREAADITAYLLSSRDPAFEDLSMPEVDAAARDSLVLAYLGNNNTIEQSQALLEGMDDHQRNLYLGDQTIRRYGCYGCHDVEGFEDAKPIGVELTEEGSKPVHQFDFGHIHDVPHTRHDWIRNKLLNPRMWDRGKEAVKTYEELYKMPNFGMSEREAQAVLVNVLGFTKESVRASRMAGQAPGTAALARGRKLITWYNCRGCHLVEGKGYGIRTAIQDVGLLPPNLSSEGARTRSDWLFGFLHDPSEVTLRPWLSVRMPTFGFDDDQVNTLLAYFSTRDGREPFLSQPPRPAPRNLLVGEVAFTMFQCAKCHPAGPSSAEAGVVSAGELAPSLLLAKARLRHDWVPFWIEDPQSWVAGTKMPANFTKNDDGSYSSPLAAAIDAPMYRAQKQRLMEVFDSEEELDAYLADADRVTEALRDHIWWNLN